MIRHLSKVLPHFFFFPHFYHTLNSRKVNEFQIFELNCFFPSLISICSHNRQRGAFTNCLQLPLSGMAPCGLTDGPSGSGSCGCHADLWLKHTCRYQKVLGVVDKQRAGKNILQQRPEQGAFRFHLGLASHSLGATLREHINCYTRST